MSEKNAPYSNKNLTDYPVKSSRGIMPQPSPLERVKKRLQEMSRKIQK
jgi:hypothetical protein